MHPIIHSLLYLTAFIAADEPRTGPPKEEGSAVRVSDLESLKPLPGTILVLCRELKDAIGLPSEGVFLNAAKYQALQERLEYLESQLKQAIPAVPTVCRLSGQIDGEIARVQARFEFVTTRPRCTVTIGCQRAWLKSGATLDDKLPMLFATDDGTLKVQVEQAGIHTLKLDLDIPVAPRGPKRQEFGFDFGLPGAAITTIDQFAFPQSITDIRINGRSNRTKPHDATTSRLEGIALGPANQLAVVWRSRGSVVSAPAATEAEGRVVVRIREQTVTTEVEMTLRPLGGEVRQWEILLPPDAIPEFRAPRTPDDRVAGIDLPQANSPKLSVRFHEPSAEPYKLSFQFRKTRSNGPIAVGPFRVQGALRERGVIVVSATPETLLRYRPRADVLQRDLSDEGRRENGVAEFTYGNLAAASSEIDATASFLTMEFDDQRAAVEARVEHRLKPKRPEISVRSVADVSLAEESAFVKQYLTFEMTGQPVRRVPVSVPRQIGDRLQVVRGGKITTDGMLELSGPPEKQHLVEIEFECPVRDDPASADLTSIPFVSFPETTRTDATVRLWTESGAAPVLAADGPWRKQPIESVADREAFPTLVARSDNLRAPLRVERRGNSPSLPPQTIERALVRVAISEDGNHHYRAQFLLRNLHSRTVEVELPRFEAIECFFDGRGLNHHEVLPAASGPNVSALRIQIPTERQTSGGIFEMRYQLMNNSGSNRVTRAILHPPVVQRAVMTGQTFWEIDLPPAHIVVWNQDAAPIIDWVLSRGLLTPRARFSADDLQAWLTNGSHTAGGANGASFVFRQGLLDSMEILYVHRQTWLIVCSLVFLAILMAILMAPLTKQARWMVASLLVALVLFLTVWRPQLVPSLVYGCQPGAVALLMMVSIREALHWKDRKRGNVLAGFRRDSSTSRRSPPWQPAEPSTIASPPARESAIKHVAEGGA